MGRFLIIDIGAGTMDILYFDSESGLHYKAVVKSPVLSLAEKAAGLKGDILVTGTEMGGGAISSLLKDRARENEVIMSVSAAATIHHNPRKVSAFGIRIIEDSEAEDLRNTGKYNTLNTCDLEPERLKRIIKGLGVPFSFDVVGICAQDHGMAPDGLSHLDFRHNIFREALDRNPHPDALLFKYGEIPAPMTRLKSIAKSARRLPTDEVYVMDSGMAAILGASMDQLARAKERFLVLDIATSHTICAAIDGEKVSGFFEYHTSEITLKRLETLLVGLADGKLEHKKILEEGGHGAYIRDVFGFNAVEIIVATGPKRRLVENSGLAIVHGAPFGDNMMTGTTGVLEAIRRHKGLDLILF